jgi:SAM-dependent methyltransferase
MGEATASDTSGFRCNICGHHSVCAKEELQREKASCEGCGSSARNRAVIRALSLELFGKSLALPDFPPNRKLCGVGMTDWEGYAVRLAEKFSYTNTYYHAEPRLDLSTTQLPDQFVAANDFVISSEVFEHVPPPVQRAFENVFAMLKPGGIFILTVPYGTGPETIEHFPELNEYRVSEIDGVYQLRNVTPDGTIQEFKDLVFHGGPGATLEMRVFAETAIQKHLAEAGFVSITIHRAPDLEHGVCWPEPWSLPFSARRPV